MKTKELIKLLQEEDPSGELHVRITGTGIPYGCESKPGYWDGAYDYIDEDDNWVRTTEGSKVDIHCQDIDTFVSEQMHAHSLKGITSFEEIKKKFKTSTTYLNGKDNDEVYNNLIKDAKEAYDSWKEIVLNSYQQSLDEMIENANKGWKWFQNKEVDNPEVGKPNLHVYYTWKIFDENNKDNSSNVHMTECVLKSGRWEKLDNNKIPGYYEWRFK